MTGHGCRGFTLVELVTVMLLMGILAAVGVARMADRQSFDALGYADQIRQTIQYARRLAVAQRRNVCVTAAAGGLTVTQAVAYGAACSTGAIDPSTGSAFNLPVPHGVTLSAASIQFDSQGRQISGATVTVTATGDGSSRVVTVENETGYVH